MSDQIQVRMLRNAEVCQVVGTSRSTLWRWVTEGEFPKARQMGKGSVGWLSSEVEQWILDRPVAGETQVEDDQQASGRTGKKKRRSPRSKARR